MQRLASHYGPVLPRLGQVTNRRCIRGELHRCSGGVWRYVLLVVCGHVSGTMVWNFSKLEFRHDRYFELSAQDGLGETKNSEKFRFARHKLQNITRHGKDKHNGDYLSPQGGANYRFTCGCATFLSETGPSRH